MQPHELADRIARLDWSGTSLQHQLAMGAAVETLQRAPSAPVSNLVRLPCPVRTVRILHLDGRVFASAGFLPGPMSDSWAWIVEIVSRELDVDPEQVDLLETDEGDVIAVDGLPAYRL